MLQAKYEEQGGLALSAKTLPLSPRGRLRRVPRDDASASCEGGKSPGDDQPEARDRGPSPFSTRGVPAVEFGSSTPSSDAGRERMKD